MSLPFRRLASLSPAAAALLVSVVALQGCPRDIPPPEGALTAPQELLAAMDAAMEPVQTARFKNAALQYYGEQGRVSVRQTLLVAQPDRLRVQTYLPGIDDTAGVLVCACGRFAYHDRQENVYYYGEADAQNISRFLPVGLTCGDVGRVLLGGPPRDRIAGASGAPTLAWDRSAGRYALTFPEGDGTLRLGVEHGTWRVSTIDATSSSGASRFRYEVDGFERIDGQPIPERRRFVVEASGEDISLKNGETQLNPALPETLFGLEAPVGTSVRYRGSSAQAPPPPPGGDLCADATPPPTPAESPDGP